MTAHLVHTFELHLSDMNKRFSPAKVALFTGAIDRHYACALGKAIATSGVALDVISYPDMRSCEMRNLSNVKLLELYAKQGPNQSLFKKLGSYIAAYARIIGYAVSSSPQIFHILWNYKFPYFDRTLLLLYYRALGKKVIFTAHNVNAAERDGIDSLWNRLTLRIQYRLVHHIFVHTEAMKDELAHKFGVSQSKITVIPFGVGDMVPQTALTPAEARQKLGLSKSDRVVLFFGRIALYKGINLLVDAFERIAHRDRSYKLIIAGEPIKESAQHWKEIHEKIESSPMREQVIPEIRYIADREMEFYFKAADVLVLPYTQIFQSGVLFMSHNFGLPVIATDVGTFRDDIVEGTNGYVCRPNDSEDLAKSMEGYFSSELFRNLDERRAGIQNAIRLSHSWQAIAETTGNIYGQVAQRAPSGRHVSSVRPTRVPLREPSDVAESHDA
jgi:D-inositol-3-phosphate glycosyltransferase